MGDGSGAKRPVGNVETTPLSPEDQAVLDMDRPHSPVNVVIALFLPPDVDATAIAHVLAERAASVPKLREYLDPERGPAWSVDGHFDVRRHVRSATGRGLADDVAAAMAAPLPRDRPAWEVIAVAAHSSRPSLLIRIHHAYGDGAAIEEMLKPLADPIEADGDNSGDSAARARLLALPTGAWRRACLGFEMLRILARRADRATELRGQPSGVKRVAWSAPCDLALLDRCAAALGSSITGLAASGYSRALRAWLLPRRAVRAHDRVRASATASVRRPGERGSTGNRFGLIALELPVGLTGAKERLDDISGQLERSKAEFEGLAAFLLGRMLARLPSPARRFALELAVSRFSVNFTSVHGPTREISIDGHPVTQMVLFAPSIVSSGLALTVFSYAGRLSLSVTADAGLVESPEAILHDVEREFAELAAFADLP